MSRKASEPDSASLTKVRAAKLAHLMKPDNRNRLNPRLVIEPPQGTDRGIRCKLLKKLVDLEGFEPSTS